MVALNTAYAAPKNAADPQNRVGDFFYEDHASVGKNRWASRLNTQEKSSYHYETASGRSNWPNRDPIKELGHILSSKSDKISQFLLIRDKIRMQIIIVSDTILHLTIILKKIDYEQFLHYINVVANEIKRLRVLQNKMLAIFTGFNCFTGISSINLYDTGRNSLINTLDKDGRLWSWATTGVGAGLGAIGGAFYGFGAELVDLAQGDCFDWSEVGKSAVGGAVVGGLTGAAVGALGGDPSALATAGLTGVGTAAFTAGAGFAGGAASSAFD
jgi:hypothetical protein